MEPNLIKELFPYPELPRFDYNPVDTELVISDTTLRDGQQGWRPFTVNESIGIYELLHRLDNGSGIIRTTELFLYTNRDREVARRIMELGYDYPEPIAWIRATMRDLSLVKEVGLDKACILTSISDYHIYYKLRLDRRKAIEKYLTVVEEALKLGIYPKVTLEDVTRSDVYGVVVPFIKKLLRLSERYGVNLIIKLADTLGLGLPFIRAPLPRSIPRLVRILINELGVKGENIEFHGHNDFHLVVANHLVAWLEGASISNCTLLGIGERAGNCPLEAMAMFYAQLKGNDGGLNLRVLRDVRDFFERIGYPIPEFHPFLGANAFRTKAGIHIDGLLKNPSVYLQYDPMKVLGIPYTVAITPYSGRAGLVYWITSRFGTNGWERLKNDARLNKVLQEIEAMFKEGRVFPITDRELVNLLRRHLPEFINEYVDRLPKSLREHAWPQVE